MQRLIALGCSLTYGHGLPDCFVSPNRPGDIPSKLVWSSIVAKYMHRDCINLSSPGASNKRIWHTITNFEYEENDVVFILWSFSQRSAIIKYQNIVDIGPWIDQLYYKHYEDKHDSIMMSRLFVSHANMFLESKHIKVYNIIPGKQELSILRFNDTVIDHIPVYITKMRENYPLALDNRHPGIECQEMYSKGILNYLNVQNDLPEHKPFNVFGKIKQYIQFTRNY